SCRDRVPIGRPLGNRSLYILDRRGVPVPIGVPGELCLGGALLARGYLNHPALTAEHFIPDPRSNERLYRTGDLARYRSDGNVEFLGRIDNRGYRIELGGKVNRAALGRQALPDQVSSGLEGAVAAPRDLVELRLTRIWEELLGVARVGIRTRFFDLGGYSLLAVRLMARIRQEFGRDLPLATLFQEGTIEHLAAILRREGDETRRKALVAIRPEGSGRPFFCVHPVGGNVLCYSDLARHLGGDSPFYGLQVPDRGGE
ncbi:MAG: AMP-binding protein, partial [bacterium]|nr:AMP-binding protein [bacterium]